MSLAYILRRLLLMIPTFIGITLLVFCITRIVPGGPIERVIMQNQQMNSDVGGGVSSGHEMRAGVLSADQLQLLKEYYGFDKPLLQSYFESLQKLLVLDLGESTRYYEPVWDTIRERLPISTFYGLMTLVLTYLVSVPLGILKAIKHKTFIDHASSIMIFIGYAVPGYIIGIALLVWFAGNLEWFPLGGFVSDTFEDLSFKEKVWDVCYHAVLPLIAYMSGSFALMTIMMKNSLMDNLAADYVRTAMAKGFSFKGTVLFHALRNSLIPLATHFGSNIGFFLTGSFLIEKIFDIDGFGLLGYESILERDYPVVMGILALTAMLQLIGNLLSDFCVAWVDPRVQFK